MITTKTINMCTNGIDVHSITDKDLESLYCILKDKENCYYQYDLPVTSRQAAENMIRLAVKDWNMYGLKPENREFLLIVHMVVGTAIVPINIIWVKVNRDITELTIRWVCAKEYKDENCVLQSVRMVIDYYMQRYKQISKIYSVCDGRNRQTMGMLGTLGFQKIELRGRDIIYCRKFVKIG